jgi:hypothetical protein
VSKMRVARFVLGLLIALAATTTALPETSTQIPTKFTIPFANGPATSPDSIYITNPIPTLSQIGILNCAASFTDGFPPLTFTPTAGGGCGPLGKDFNGIFYMVSRWSQWQAMGGPVFYDSSFASSISGYPKWTTLANAGTPGCFWVSQTDGNSNNPDTGGANWLSMCPTSGNTGTSTGSANAQAVTSAPFATVSGVPTVGAQCTFAAGFSNSGPLKVNCNSTGSTNVYRRSQLGATMSVGGEVISGQLVTLIWDGTEWQCTSCRVVMVGELRTFAGTGNTPPTGTLFADGSCQATSNYGDLSSVVGTSTYGSCSAGNFALPDARSNIMVAVANQGSNGTSSNLSNCGNQSTQGGKCGSQNQALSSTNQLPQFTPTGTWTQTYSGTVTVQPLTALGNGSNAHLVSGQQTGNQTYAQGPIALNGDITGTIAINPIGAVSPSNFTIIPPMQFVRVIIQL